MLSYIWLGIAALLVAVDQLVKFWAEHSLSQVDTIPLISGVFHLTYVQNFGAAFNTMNNQRFLLVGVTSAVLLLILVLLLTQKLRSPWMICSWSLILSGGAGNLVDRLFRPAMWWTCLTSGSSIFRCSMWQTSVSAWVSLCF